MPDRRENQQFAFLNRLRREHVRVDVYLVTGTRLQGRILSFDARMLLLHTDSGQMALFHQAVSSVQKSAMRAKGRPPRMDEGRPQRADDEGLERPALVRNPRPASPTTVVVTRRKSRTVVKPQE